MKYKLHHQEKVDNYTVRIAVVGGWLYRFYYCEVGEAGRAMASGLVFVADSGVEIEG